MKNAILFCLLSLAGITLGIPAHASTLPANELGRIPVLEYHRFGPSEGRWTRTPANFRSDLEWLYNNDYVLISASTLSNGTFNVPAGKKPVVLTFDDASDGQFKFLHDGSGKLRRDAKGNPLADPNTAVGVLDAFAKAHPDFGMAAVFYVLPNAFEVAAESGEKLRYLLASGRELGNHTYNHAMLKKLSPSQINAEMVKAQDEVVRELGKSYAFQTLALPYGIYPKDEAGTMAVIAGSASGQHYRHNAVFLVGADPAPSPFDRKFNFMKVPRIQAIDAEWQRHFRRAPRATGRGDEAFKPFVSDGNSSTVSYPPKLEDRLNSKALGNRKPVSLQKTAFVFAGGGGGPVSAPKAQVAQVLHVHPGYRNAPLPAGGEYVNGQIFHTVQKGQDPTWIANRYLWMSDYYTRPDFEKAIMSKNGQRNWIPVGKRIEIPGVRASQIVPKTVAKPKSYAAKGIYVTRTSAGTERVFSLVKQMKPMGLNTVVFDIKDMDGILAYESKVPLAVKTRSFGRNPSIRDVPKLVDRLHQQGIHVVARIALFHDSFLAQHAPYLALQSKSGRPWREKGKLAWLDPNNREVREYNLGITKELLAMGVDEIQYDYIRFPAMGAVKDIAYSFDPLNTPKHAIITHFMKEAYQIVHPTGALLSLDVFGVVAWDEGIDVKHTGQRLEDLAKYADVISPMVYPSHFYPPFFGHKYPADEPYFFVNEGVLRTAKKASGSNIVVRPWLQAFKFMVHNYGPDYVTKQLKGAADASATGYLLWNAGNEYGMAFKGVSNFSEPHATKRSTTTKP